MIRQTAEFLPDLKEQKQSKSFNFGTFKNNKLSWLSVLGLLILIIAVSAYIPYYIENKLYSNIELNNSSINKVNFDLTAKKLKAVNLLNQIGNDNSYITEYDKRIELIINNYKPYDELVLKQDYEQAKSDKEAVKINFIDVLKGVNDDLNLKNESNFKNLNAINELLDSHIATFEKQLKIIESITNDKDKKTALYKVNKSLYKTILSIPTFKFFSLKDNNHYILDVRGN